MDKDPLILALQDALDKKDTLKLEELCKIAVSQYADQAFGYVFLADLFCLVDAIDYPKVELVLAKAIELEPENIPFKLRFARLKMDQGAYVDASIIGQQILDLEPTQADALHLLAACLWYGFNDAEQAITPSFQNIKYPNNYITFIC